MVTGSDLLKMQTSFTTISLHLDVSVVFKEKYQFLETSGEGRSDCVQIQVAFNVPFILLRITSSK